MHPAFLQALARQRTAEPRAARPRRRPRPARPGAAARRVRQRIGWALVHTGLRLVVQRDRA